MAMQLIDGSEVIFETGLSVQTGDTEVATVTIEGAYSSLKSENAESYVPSGYALETKTLATTGNGMGKLTLVCIKQNSGSSFDALRTTYTIDMMECTYDLEDHPSLTEVRDDCIEWVSDGCIYHGQKYYKIDEGEEVEITEGMAKKFCAAYMAGIKTFVRFYPVINRIGYYSNPPGMSKASGATAPSGNPTFSSNIGSYDTPPISLAGYASTNWFKSKDSWEEIANKSWRRVEQWTYTPESSSSDHAWIYQ